MILFPLTGPASQHYWISSAKEIDLPVIIGGYMTHEKYVQSEGGYIDDPAIQKIYTNAAFQGVTDYVVPGNKPDVINDIRALLLTNSIDPVFYAPGFIAQGGRISDAAKVAGAKWHAIVGRAIYEAHDIQKAVTSLSNAL